MDDKQDLLTCEEVRQHLAEEIPGFAQLLAAALGCKPVELFSKLEAGQLTKLEAIAALAKSHYALRPSIVVEHGK